MVLRRCLGADLRCVDIYAGVNAQLGREFPKCVICVWLNLSPCRCDARDSGVCVAGSWILLPIV